MSYVYITTYTLSTQIQKETDIKTHLEDTKSRKELSSSTLPLLEPECMTQMLRTHARSITDSSN